MSVTTGIQSLQSGRSRSSIERSTFLWLQHMPNSGAQMCELVVCSSFQWRAPRSTCKIHPFGPDHDDSGAPHKDVLLPEEWQQQLHVNLVHSSQPAVPVLSRSPAQAAPVRDARPALWLAAGLRVQAPRPPVVQSDRWLGVLVADHSLSLTTRAHDVLPALQPAARLWVRLPHRDREYLTSGWFCRSSRSRLRRLTCPSIHRLFVRSAG